MTHKKIYCGGDGCWRLKRKAVAGYEEVGCKEGYLLALVLEKIYVEGGGGKQLVLGAMDTSELVKKAWSGVQMRARRR